MMTDLNTSACLSPASTLTYAMFRRLAHLWHPVITQIINSVQSVCLNCWVCAFHPAALNQLTNLWWDKAMKISSSPGIHQLISQALNHPSWQVLTLYSHLTPSWLIAILNRTLKRMCKSSQCEGHDNEQSKAPRAKQILHSHVCTATQFIKRYYEALKQGLLFIKKRKGIEKLYPFELVALSHLSKDLPFSVSTHDQPPHRPATAKPSCPGV